MREGPGRGRRAGGPHAFRLDGDGELADDDGRPEGDLEGVAPEQLLARQRAVRGDVLDAEPAPGEHLDDRVLAAHAIALEPQGAALVPTDGDRPRGEHHLRARHAALGRMKIWTFMGRAGAVAARHLADGGVFGNASTFSMSPE